jgi:hypothetical protein
MASILLQWLRMAMATGAVLGIPAFAIVSVLSGGGGSAVELARADDPIHAGFRVMAPRQPARAAMAVAASTDAGEVVLTSWTFTDNPTPSPWQGGGTPTTTLYTGRTTSVEGDNIVLTCSVTGSNKNLPPGLTVTFFVSGASVGSATLVRPSSGQTSTASLPFSFHKHGTYPVYVHYNGDFNDMPSTSPTVNVIVNQG